MEPLEQFKKLDRMLTKRKKDLEPADLYLTREQPMQYMAPALKEEFGDRVTQLVLDLPAVIVEAYESVLDVRGFTIPDRTAAAAEPGAAVDATPASHAGNPVTDLLWEIWGENQMDEQMPLLQYESIGLGSAYIISGPGDSNDDAPLMTVESPFEVFGQRDPRSRRISAAVKRWQEEDESGKPVQWGNLYLPGERRVFFKAGRDWVEDAGLRSVHGDPTTRVVEFPNRPRLLSRTGESMMGRSEFEGIIPVLDAVNKMATDMMISGEFHAMPRRYAFGLTKEDFQDENGNPLSVWKQLAGGVWASEMAGDQVKVGQFDEADLSVFHNSIKLLLAIAFMQAALPSHISAFQGDNPTSEPAIKAAEIQKTKRAERKQTFIGGALAEVQRNNWMIMGRPLNELRGLETTWRNPATPTRAQEADASVKLVQAKVIPPQQARKDLNYSPSEREQMEEWDRLNAMDPFFERTMRDTGDVDGG